MNTAVQVKLIPFETVRVFSGEVAGWKTGFSAIVQMRGNFDWEGKITVKVVVNFFALDAVCSEIQTFILMGDHWRRLTTIGDVQKLEREKFNILWDHPSAVTL